MLPSYERYDAFWARFLGVEAHAWQSPGLSLTAHVGLAGYTGAWFFQRNERVVVSAPPAWVPTLSARCAAPRPFAELVSETELHALFGAAIERTIGPAFQGALRPERFNKLAAVQVRALTTSDDAAVAALCIACGREDVEQSGVEVAPLFRAGYFHAGELVALAGFRCWDDQAGDPCVLTHPARRARGYGAAVVSWTVERALAAQRLPLYQTLESHTGAVRIALRLGFEQYARHVAVRLNR